MVMDTENYYVSDNPIKVVREDGKTYLKTEPHIEEISKADIKMALVDLMKNKPQQVGLGEFKIRYCDNCATEYILHNRQTFCPICKVMTEIIKEDANIGYDDLFQVWQADKNFLEDILYGNKDAVLYVVDEDDDDIELKSVESKGMTYDGKWMDGPKVEEL